ncbi:antitoxin Xre-like helix-turn-helix domain-containing protein [Thioclava sp. F28-4]|uniref:antitoxin Xre-like helix-turn-helix domain-containing protein n=1 Tax=Thioclava sp. F28-4 TaxID=1915315 RepID=UPI000997F369|nr:antitoxin Xre-like helix-turn-helix domain-containing protein [Thioclava sp. F28-4]OOY03168.1 DUF2384 domain-containing protein [Thioclava sp. F28-4]
MQMNGTTQDPAKIATVALKAFARIAASWGLSEKEAAGLADISESEWTRARTSDFAGELTQDQLLRLSAVVGIYQALELYFSEPLARSWFTQPNTDHLFGGRRPIETAIEGGLLQILAIRTYLDGLLEGA